jgi:hypothetical protein
VARLNRHFVRLGIAGLSLRVSERSARRAPQIVDQDIVANQQNPGGEHKQDPLEIPAAEQQEHRTALAKQRDPAQHEARLEGERGGHDHEDHRYFEGIATALPDVPNKSIDAPNAAAAPNSVPRNSNPLPRNTVAKNWSSSVPRRSRSGFSARAKVG